MVDNTIALQVKPAEITDLSTSLLRSYQIKNAEQQNQIGGITLEAARAKQGALSDYAMRAKANDPQAYQALAGQPDLQAQVFTNMSSERENRVRMIADAAKAVYPLQGKPEFKEAWAREVDSLYKNGAISEPMHRQWRDNPSELALNQALAMGAGLDTYLKTEGQKTAAKMADAVTAALGGRPAGAEGAPAGAPGQPAAAGGPRVDAYQANLIGGESRGRNVANASGPGGTPTSSAFGVVQFLKGTWDDLIKANPDLGYTAADRFVPEKQIEMEKRFRRKNAETLAAADIAPTDRNLYMAHFLGADGAKKFLMGMAENPNRPAIELVDGDAAAANRSVFYSPGGQPKTARQVYENQTHKFGDGMTGIQSIQPQRAGMPAQATINDRIAAAAPVLVSAAMQPGMAEETRKTFMELAKVGFQHSQPTSDERDWQSYARAEIDAGREPLNRLEWKKAQQKPTVTIDQKSESALEAKRGEGLGSRLNKIAEQGQDARQQLALVGRLGNLLETSGTGSKQAFTNWVRGTLGPDIAKTLGPNAGDIEAANALINYLLPRMRVAGTGTTSDRDLAAFQAALPSLLSDENGKRLVTQTLGGIYKMQADAAEIAERWQVGEYGPAEAVKKLRELGDPFESFRAHQEKARGRAGAPAPQMPSFATKADVQEAIRQGKLGPGDQFLIGSGPEAGKVGTVPGTKPAPAPLLEQ